jgi:hypothetical protein
MPGLIVDPKFNAVISDLNSTGGASMKVSMSSSFTKIPAVQSIIAEECGESYTESPTSANSDRDRPSFERASLSKTNRIKSLHTMPFSPFAATSSETPAKEIAVCVFIFMFKSETAMFH